jgi:TonB family protein
MKKKFLILVSLFVCIFSIYAQELAVQSFVLAETDLTANTPGTMVQDQNGNVCALIKVETTQKGFTFDVGVLGVMSVVEKPAEIWVYVPFGVRKITIQHPQLGMLRDYLIPCVIEKGRTYIMKLVTGTVKTVVEYAQTKQFLYVTLDPADAILEINGKIKATEGGAYQELMPFGKYTYKAYCQNYHDLAGIVEISDPDKKHELNIKLKPAFGHLSVLGTAQSDLDGAAVYVDEKYVGRVPVRNMLLNSGTHSIRVIKEMYEAYNATFNITDEENKQLTPRLAADFADVTLVTADGAEIYINDELKGRTSWKGKLASGSYMFESRKEGHMPYKMSYDITRSDQGKNIQIQAPTPIYGSLVISTTPGKAKVSINGKPVGETPMFVSRQIIGTHIVDVVLDGYKKQTKTVTVSEGQEANLSFALEKLAGPISSTTDQKQHNFKVNRTITTQEATINIGEYIDAQLLSGKVTRWSIGSAYAEFIESPSSGVIRAKKAGSVSILGYINNLPKLFELTIVEPPVNNSVNQAVPNKAPANTKPAPVVEVPADDEEPIPFQLVEVKPSFMGGDANKFSTWVNQRLVYPDIAKENGVQGRVTLQFTVGKDGSLYNIKVLRGVDPSLDKEAVRVASLSPKWTPGMQRGEPVPVTYTFPVIFQLR